MGNMYKMTARMRDFLTFSNQYAYSPTSNKENCKAGETSETEMSAVGMPLCVVARLTHTFVLLGFTLSHPPLQRESGNESNLDPRLQRQLEDLAGMVTEVSVASGR